MIKAVGPTYQHKFFQVRVLFFACFFLLLIIREFMIRKCLIRECKELQLYLENLRSEANQNEIRAEKKCEMDGNENKEIKCIMLF